VCRLFGFRSVVEVATHHSLVLAENALARQSRLHPHGWGIGYFDGPIPVLRRSAAAAFGDDDFDTTARYVRSHAVVAHVRKATVGAVAEANAHPFRFGLWLFAHNGTLKAFGRWRDKLVEAIDWDLRVEVKGSTDSEHCFYLFLSHLRRLGVDPTTRAPGRLAADALAAMVGDLMAWSKAAGADPPIANFIASDGRCMVACRLGRELLFSTQKRFCEQMDNCARWQEDADLNCMHPLRDAAINHILVSSEAISSEDIWEALKEGELVGVDADFNFIREPMSAESSDALAALYAPFYPSCDG
jgi:glutamine amidotransferase